MGEVEEDGIHEEQDDVGEWMEGGKSGSERKAHSPTPAPEARGVKPEAWKISLRCGPTVVHCVDIWDCARVKDGTSGE